MAWPENAMDVFKLLDKSNCRECGSPTCLAFAAEVFKGQKRLGACPHMDAETVARYGGEVIAHKGLEAEIEAHLEKMKRSMPSLDMARAAKRLGGIFANGKLTVKILGKDFSVDGQGNLSSDIHIHGWISLPFFDYVLNAKGAPLSGKWLPLRELDNGKDWANFFDHRVEKPLKKVADTYTDLFEDLVHLFNGKQVENHYQSDISLVLHPLPLVPMLICYWKPEDGLASDLNIFFDSQAEQNLPIGSIYRLAAGMVVMLEKIALRHGVASNQ